MKKKTTVQCYNCKSLYNFASTNKYTYETGKKQALKRHISRDIEFGKETLCLCVFYETATLTDNSLKG